MLLVGIRAKNMPVGEEIDVLIDFIERNFGNHTPEEIKMAFNMAVSGRLTLGKEGANCFENFSCEYFGKIMAAYRNWANTEIKQIPAEVDETNLLEAPPADWSNVWEDILEAAREGNINSKIVSAVICDWLVEKGCLELNPYEQEDIFDRAVAIYISELSESATPEDRQTLLTLKSENWESNLKLYNRVKNRAKVIAVKEYALTQI
jgi:hypothetical protein